VLDVTDDAVVDRRTDERFSRDDMALPGGHNALNVAAAVACVRPFGVTADTVRRVLREFRGLPHRTALVAEVHGVRFYDDSKGTNVGAAVTALEGLREPKAVLIAAATGRWWTRSDARDARRCSSGRRRTPSRARWGIGSR
jgi:UDP-N-acetylmuramoylalanine--D-glutamate ligase